MVYFTNLSQYIVILRLRVTAHELTGSVTSCGHTRRPQVTIYCPCIVISVTHEVFSAVGSKAV